MIWSCMYLKGFRERASKARVYGTAIVKFMRHFRLSAAALHWLVGCGSAHLAKPPRTNRQSSDEGSAAKGRPVRLFWRFAKMEESLTPPVHEWEHHAASEERHLAGTGNHDGNALRF